MTTEDAGSRKTQADAFSLFVPLFVHVQNDFMNNGEQVVGYGEDTKALSTVLSPIKVWLNKSPSSPRLFQMLQEDLITLRSFVSMSMLWFPFLIPLDSYPI